MEELELGLSLCAKKTTTTYSGESDGETSWKWGKKKNKKKKSCGILTAEDFPIPALISSSSSVSSSSISANNGEGLGEKRDGDLASPQIGGMGNANSFSQGLVGWPPVRAFRMNNMANQYKDNMPESNNTSEQKKKIHNSSLKQNPMGSKEIKDHKNIDGSHFIKVNMDGDPIGRKVDLNAHESYKALALALEIMFYKPTSSYGMKALKLLDGSNEFALTYEDKDGDWMLVGDVPWSMFLDTVKRLRIMKISEASGQKLRLSFSHESGVLSK